MVFGILVIILGILGIAVWSRGGTPESNIVSAGSGDGIIPVSPATPPMKPVGSDDPGVDPPGGRGFVEPPDDGSSSGPDDFDPVAVPIEPGVDEPVVEQPPEPAVEADPPAPTTYTVKSGDTLERIARDLLGDRKHVADIQKANPGLNPQKIFVGQVIKLPVIDSKSSPAPNAPAVEKSGSDSVKPKVDPSKSTAMPMTHTIQPGDNLVKISRKYYHSIDKVNAIYNANRDVIKDRNNLPVGKTIKLPNP